MMNHIGLTVSSFIKKVAVVVALALAVTTQSVAFEHQHGDSYTIAINQAWARALPPVVPNGAAYLTVTNNHDVSDTLEGVSSNIAKHSMLHESYFKDGKVAMRHLEQLPILAGQSIEFKPGGYHIMLMGLTRALVEGESFNVTLHFKNAGDITSEVTIAKRKMTHNHHH